MMRRSAGVVAVCLALAAPASAQQNEPIGRFVADVRGVFVRHKSQPSVATDLGVVPGNMPPRSYGLSSGVHYYPFHFRAITFGIGGEFVYARSSRTLPPSADGTTPGATVRRHFESLAPEFSLNFGHRNGWSYISGGMFGRSKLYADRAGAPASGAQWRSTVNYGGGGRWFKGQHLAFSVDFRWFSNATEAATDTIVLQPRTTMLVLSGGIGIR
ncbi:MAG: hypothetical protein ACRD1V_03075 [Vicinamibacterales bacterium]